MIYVIVVRRCQCEICEGIWDLEADQGVPAKCIHCGSKDWLFGREALDSRFIRQRISRDEIVKNPGAKARNRQVRGQEQFRHFKPKPVDADADAADN